MMSSDLVPKSDIHGLLRQITLCFDDTAVSYPKYPKNLTNCLIQFPNNFLYLYVPTKPQGASAFFRCLVPVAVPGPCWDADCAVKFYIWRNCTMLNLTRCQTLHPTKRSSWEPRFRPLACIWTTYCVSGFSFNSGTYDYSLPIHR